MYIILNFLISSIIIAELKDYLRILVSGYRASISSKKINAEIATCLSADNNHGIPNTPSLIAENRNSVADFFNMNNDASNRADWVTQFKILSGRTFKNLYRNPLLLRGIFLN